MVAPAVHREFDLGVCIALRASAAVVGGAADVERVAEFGNPGREAKQVGRAAGDDDVSGHVRESAEVERGVQSRSASVVEEDGGATGMTIEVVFCLASELGYAQ